MGGVAGYSMTVFERSLFCFAFSFVAGFLAAARSNRVKVISAVSTGGRLAIHGVVISLFAECFESVRHNSSYSYGIIALATVVASGGRNMEDWIQEKIPEFCNAIVKRIKGSKDDA